MPKFENNVLGMVTKEDWLEIGQNLQVARPNDPIDAIVGDEAPTANLTAKMESIASEYQIPVMAQFHGFDTESQKTFRAPIDSKNIEKGLIKVKIDQSERMRALLRSGVQNDELYDYVLDDGIRLADQVITRTKVAKNEMLYSGQVTIHENNLNLTVDYGVPDANKALSLDFGAGASSPVPDQLEAIVSMAVANGVTLTGLVTSRALINKMRRNLAIQKAVNGVNMQGVLLSNADLRAYLSDEYGLNDIIVNDLTYGVFGGYDANGRPIVNTHRYFPQDKVSFFAGNTAGRVGTGLWGLPPETDVSNLLDVRESNLPNVYITQWSEHDPAVLWTKASTLFMPVLYNPNGLYIATAAETPGA